ncbi:MAG: S8 family serine peptidase [Byssovorax sp.]
MAEPNTASSKPRTFFLNEYQELANIEREGGGRQANYVPVDWSARSDRLGSSFRKATAPAASSRDPVVGRHCFIVAVPVAKVEKISVSKKAQAQGGILQEVPSFGGEQSRLFRRLGMDLLDTLPGGKATVHVPASKVPQFLSTIASLPNANSRERSRWLTFEQFEPINWHYRVSPQWLETLPGHDAVLAMIRFQPLLSRVDVQDILTSIRRLLAADEHEELISSGREFSGRYWCRARLGKKTITSIAEEFGSVQSIHSPLIGRIASASKKRVLGAVATVAPPLPSYLVADLPTVAVVDTGVPIQHSLLQPFLRAGGYRDPNLDPSVMYMGDHGTKVASCVVFGRVNMNAGLASPPPGMCRVHDVMVSIDDQLIDEEIVFGAISAVIGTAPDVRVFNMSYGGPPLDSYDETEKRERIIKTQDLDNLAFARDILMVVAAGNSVPGVRPSKAYPGHVDDPRWALGSLARSFNGIVCGSYVDSLNPDAIAAQMGAPSPFTRIGPGSCNSPVPGFGAPGGDALEDYRRAHSTGIWVCTADGTWEDHAGTSMAAPLLAREAAWVFKELSRYCEPGTRPFAATVKAWLNLVAVRRGLRGAFEKLAERTLGKGFATADRLQSPDPNTAVFIWQTLLQMPGSVARVQVPMPLSWLLLAKQPKIRVVLAWETPVNHTLTESWGCRKVNLKLRPFGASAALRGRGNASGSYPLIDRIFDIRVQHLRDNGYTPTEVDWVIEVDYEETGEYPPAMTFSPQQRVGVVIEVFDEAPETVSPQPAIMALPASAQMTRLSLHQRPFQVPVVLK